MNPAILESLVGPHSVLVLGGPEHLRQRKRTSRTPGHVSQIHWDTAR